MQLRLGHFLSLLACVYLVGGHWAVLRSVAWIGMLADYGRTYGAGKAVTMTFDGEHPCSMCRSIQEKKAGEQKKDLPAEKRDRTMKAEFLYASQRLPSRLHAFSRFRWSVISVRAESRRDAPPQPVPRGVV